MASRPTDPGAENTTDPNLDSSLHSCKTRGGTQTPAQSWVGMVGGGVFPTHPSRAWNLGGHLSPSMDSPGAQLMG